MKFGFLSILDTCLTDFCVSSLPEVTKNQKQRFSPYPITSVSFAIAMVCVSVSLSGCQETGSLCHFRANCCLTLSWMPS